MCRVIFSLLWKVQQFQSIIVLNWENSIVSNVLAFNSALRACVFLHYPKHLENELISTHLLPIPSRHHDPNGFLATFLTCVNAQTTFLVIKNLRVIWLLLIPSLVSCHASWPSTHLPLPTTTSFSISLEAVLPALPPPTQRQRRPRSGLYYVTSERPCWFSHLQVFSLLRRLESFSRFTFL